MAHSRSFTAFQRGLVGRAAAAHRGAMPRLGRAAAWLLALSLLFALVARGGSAAESGKTITIGETNSAAERDQLLAYFEAEEADTVIVVTVDDTKRAMDGMFDMSLITTAYSSTALTCRDLGDGLDVTTRNITVVTPGLYAMALVTAGMGDARLVVAAPDGRTLVEGMTGLAGVFESWDAAPCASGNTTPERQRLALEELTLTAQIGLGLQAIGLPNGVQLATDVVLATQQTIVTEGLNAEAEIDAAIAAREQAAGIQIPPEQRGQLLDLMVRLARANIDWGTFAAGWTIETNPDNTQITMRGDGIAIRNAQASATARAGAALTATAAAQAALTATVEAEAALTAEAEAALTATADAQATQEAIAALTATAAAQPTATPVPSPTPTPAPFAVSGKLVAAEDGGLTIEATEGGEQDYPVFDGTTFVRDGERAAFDDLAAGDSVNLLVDGMTRTVVRVDAEAAPVGLLARLTWMGWLLPVALVAPSALWLWRRRGEEPFVVREVGARGA